MCRIPELRLNIVVVNEKLNTMANVKKDSPARGVMVTLHNASPKHKWAANAPFPAVIKEAISGDVAIFNMATGQKEILPSTVVKINELGSTFDYKGHRYVQKDTINGVPRYEIKK